VSVRLSQLVKRDLAVDPPISAVTADSRKAGPGVLFAALPGTKVDGRDFIPAALAAGAAAVIAAEDTPDIAVPLIRTSDPRRAYARRHAARDQAGEIKRNFFVDDDD
jgi:UDP-N-acetylmuramoyl-L-alanyl-D-glutamate--2,6-diaminopimelate ligase